MKFQDAISWCHVRSSIYRKSNPETKYPKNHDIPFEERVSVEDQRADDWLEYDPADDYPPYYRLA